VFQCSSASRKFLNPPRAGAVPAALRVSVLFSEPKIPQFSGSNRISVLFTRRFSALQRAENSSIIRKPWDGSAPVPVSVLFSEPKIPQCFGNVNQRRRPACFSALQRAENSSMTNTRTSL